MKHQSRVIRVVLCVVGLLGLPAIAHAQFYPGSTIDFGQQGVGTDSREKLVVQVRHFPGSINGVAVNVLGTNFRRGPSSTCPTIPISLSADCFVTVIFAPTSPGALTATVEAHYTLCNLGCVDQTWELKGTGVAVPTPGPGQPPSPVPLAPYIHAGYSFLASYGPLGTPVSQSGMSRPQTGDATIQKDLSAGFMGDSFEFSSFSTSEGLVKGPEGLSLNAGAYAAVGYDIRSAPNKRFSAQAYGGALSFFRYESPRLRGRPGVALLTFKVDGTVVSAPGQTSVEAALFVDSGPAKPLNPNNLLGPWNIQFISGINNCALCQIWEFPATTSTTITAKVPFVWGDWTALWADFASFASVISPSGLGTLQADFAHTLSLVSAEATDEFGAVVPNATVQAASSDAIHAVIDVYPGDSSNVINLNSRGKFQVAILSSPTFDATHVAVNTIHFGGAPVSQNKQGKYVAAPFDVDGDGVLDFVVEFDTKYLTLNASDNLGFLEGQTVDGSLFHGADVVTVLPLRAPLGN